MEDLRDFDRSGLGSSLSEVSGHGGGVSSVASA